MMEYPPSQEQAFWRMYDAVMGPPGNEADGLCARTRSIEQQMIEGVRLFTNHEDRIAAIENRLPFNGGNCRYIQNHESHCWTRRLLKLGIPTGGAGGLGALLSRLFGAWG